MTLTQAAVLVLAVWLILAASTAVSSTVELIFGIAAAGLVMVEALRR